MGCNPATPTFFSFIFSIILVCLLIVKIILAILLYFIGNTIYNAGHKDKTEAAQFVNRRNPNIGYLYMFLGFIIIIISIVIFIKQFL